MPAVEAMGGTFLIGAILPFIVILLVGRTVEAEEGEVALAGEAEGGVDAAGASCLTHLA